MLGSGKRKGIGKGYNVPGIETDRMERGLGRLRIGGENRREGED